MIYAECSGPGGLKLAEFMAEKMGIQSGRKLLDVGFNRGLQTCFLAKEYDILVIGIDPWNDRKDSRPHVDHLMKNADRFEVGDKVIGIKAGVPDTLLPCNCFDYVYSTTTLEMIRVLNGIEKYVECLREIYHVLKPGGIFGLGEPMHLNVEIPEEIRAFVTTGDLPFEKCFATSAETKNAVELAGFKVIEYGYANDARTWWEEYAMYDPGCKAEDGEEKRAIEDDKGRWISFGYEIAEK